MQALIILIFICFLLLKLYLKKLKTQREIKEAGNKGEEIADERINSILNRDDYLIRNIEINYKNKRTELDKVIINKNGIFIIEVKNYSGTIYGEKDDEYWKKYKVTDAGNTYEKDIKNPLIQLNRQINILSNYLKSKRINIWINGYVYMINSNSPIKDSLIINNINELDKVIHNSNNELSEKEINKIIKLLK